VAPPGILLVGDHHITRGNVFVIGGAPGVGKSRVSVALGEAGATGYDWLGLPVHCKFRMLIIQSENGRYRLQKEFENLDTKLLDQYLAITPPPLYGLSFGRQEFRDQITEWIDDNGMPGIVLIDPWNSVARDDKQRDYLEAFELVQSLFPSDESGPALGIIAHTRKPSPIERVTGRGLMNTLAGSIVLASIPRSIWILQPASDDVLNKEVVSTCCKNNDGELGPRGAWVRDNGLWTPVVNFDWDKWDNPKKKKDTGSGVSEEAMNIVFANGAVLTKQQAADALMKLTGLGKTVVYDALHLTKGKFAGRIFVNGKTMIWKP
jgi:hypothetical protein